MKRIVTLLCMIACVLCLAGCQKKASMTEFEQQKVDAAKKTTALIAFDLLEGSATQSTIDRYAELTKEEVEYIVNQQFQLEVDGGSFYGMLTSFQKGLEEIGEVQNLGEATARIDKHQIIVDVPVTGAKGEAIAEFVISNDMFQKVEGAALNPKKSFGQMMQKAGLNTVIGMGTVFSMLLFMSILISCFGIIPKIMGQGKKEKESQANT